MMRPYCWHDRETPRSDKTIFRTCIVDARPSTSPALRCAQQSVSPARTYDHCRPQIAHPWNHTARRHRASEDSEQGCLFAPRHRYLTGTASTSETAPGAFVLCDPPSRSSRSVLIPASCELQAGCGKAPPSVSSCFAAPECASYAYSSQWPNPDRQQPTHFERHDALLPLRG